MARQKEPQDHPAEIVDETRPVYGGAIYAAISAITADILEYGGIAKDRYNDQQRFNFRGIDDILRVCAPLLVKHKVICVPRVISHEFSMRLGKEDKKSYATHLSIEFDFVSTVDGSCVTATVVGEGADMADKASNKAMSTAMKYAFIQTFAIPTEVDDPDADGEVADVSADEQAKVTSEQLGVLRGLIKELDVPETIPCRVFKVDKLEDLLSIQFPAAEKKLRETLRKKQEEKK